VAEGPGWLPGFFPVCLSLPGRFSFGGCGKLWEPFPLCGLLFAEACNPQPHVFQRLPAALSPVPEMGVRLVIILITIVSAIYLLV
jgi:hypothetical protein